jgi:hypothetical protein
VTDVRAALEGALAVLDEQARQAKRREAQAKREARAIRQTIARVYDACAEIGIDLHIQTQPARRQSHGADS